MKLYLDYLYKQKAKIQAEIDQLAETAKEPKSSNCVQCGCPIEAELKAKREHILMINQSIERYIDIHR